MLLRYPLGIALVLATAFGAAATADPAQALQIWTGRNFYFARADFADWTQPANQDRITPGVWLTRKDTQGIFNIRQEVGYSAPSPIDTEWATGDALNYAGLTFRPWVQWASANPASTVGVNAVVHLISEDIYVDIRFASWTSGALGGGFSYYRAREPVVPADRTTWGRIKSLHR